MQECFRKYPDIYGSELTDDDADDDGQALPEGLPEAATKAVESDAAPEAATKTVESDAAPEAAKAAETDAPRPAPAAKEADAAPLWEDARATKERVEKQAARDDATQAPQSGGEKRQEAARGGETQ